MAGSKLKKELNLYDVFAISTGAMFSSGFFLLPGIAAAQTGQSVYLAYLASGFLIIPAMLSVAELSTAMPKAGGTYYFLDRSLGPMFGTIGGLGSWIALMFKSAFALIGMGAYLTLYVDVSFTALALILTVLFGILNIFGAKETTMLQRILVTVLVLILGVFIIQGLEAVSFFNGASSSALFFSDGMHGFISTIGLVFVSYAGLTKVASVAEEVSNPDRNIPLGMMLSLFVASLIYAVGVYIMQAYLPAEQFYTSLTPVADAGAEFMSWLPGGGGVLAIVIAAVAAFASTGNAGIMSASRYPFAMSKDQLMSPRFGKLSKKGTPVFAIGVTVVSMILILLIFNVEAVAKLASAFQLLLFGLMCFAVIVMRESNITGYHPGFKSPLYPWVQIFGMMISVWLIAEMGFLAVSLTGFIIILCVGWYMYYTQGQINRKGAIFHVHERLGRQRYEGLEYEMFNIINDKSTDQHLSYKEVIARSVITDIDKEKAGIKDVLAKASKIWASSLDIDRKEILTALQQNYKKTFSKLGAEALASYFTLPNIKRPELIIFRMKNLVDLEIEGVNEQLCLYAILVTPEDEEGLDIRLLGHLAETVQAKSFVKRWMSAKTQKELRQPLLTDEHFTDIKVKRSKLLAPYVGQKIRDLSLPNSCLITIIYRNQKIIIPHGDTVIEYEDEFLMIGEPVDIKTLISD